MFKNLFNLLFTVLGVVLGAGLAEVTVYILREEIIIGVYYDVTSAQEICGACIGAIILGLIFCKLTPLFRKQSVKATDAIDESLQNVSTNELIASIGGLVVGLMIAFLISQIYAIGLQSQKLLLIILNLTTYICFAYIGAALGSKRGKDVINSVFTSRGNRTGNKKAKQKDICPKILDTSVIIDGRIAEIMKTGFIEGNIIIPEFVLLELQHIADSSDSLKRNRGRRGLDILNRIQLEYGIDIYNTSEDKSLEEIPEVDVKLLKLAQIMGGKVVTNDFNLNKVAHIKGVEVLNINELANTLKPVVLPGEDMEVFPVKEGKEHNQAIAYLDDGTMIVIEDGRRHIGKSITAIVTSVLQTSAGRMIFVKPKRQGR